MEPAPKSALLVLTATVFATPTYAEGQWTTGVMVTAETGYYDGIGDGPTGPSVQKWPNFRTFVNE
jgi:hypothetical protein